MSYDSRVRLHSTNSNATTATSSPIQNAGVVLDAAELVFDIFDPSKKKHVRAARKFLKRRGA